MEKKQFKIRAKFVFSGHAVVSAATRQEAEEIVEKGLHALLGSVQADPATEDGIIDWRFGMHADTVVNRREEEGNG